MVKFTFGRPVPAMSPYEESSILASLTREAMEREYYMRQDDYANCQKAYKQTYSLVSWVLLTFAIATVVALVFAFSQSVKVAAAFAALIIAVRVIRIRHWKRKTDFAQERLEACPPLNQIKNRDNLRRAAPADTSFEMGSISRAKSGLNGLRFDDDFWLNRTKPERSQSQVVFETDDGDVFGHIDEPEAADEPEDAECDDEPDDVDDKLENLSKMIQELEDLIRTKK